MIECSCESLNEGPDKICDRQILRYQNNQAYTPHADYLTPSRDENHNYKTNGVGTNRFATILLYMSDLGENDGGETVFTEAWPLGTPEEEKLSKPELIRKLRESGVTEGKLEPGSWEEEMYAECRAKLAIRPRQGRAVLFYSQFPNGIEDTNARHGACPVLNGTKWAANLWVWSGPRPEYEHAPKRWPDRPDKDIKAREPKQLYAEFRNTGSDPAFADAELYYEDTLFGKLDAEGPPIAVNTFEGHKWNVRVNGETLQQFVISKKERQVFQV